jgi:hypothetical protein
MSTPRFDDVRRSASHDMIVREQNPRVFRGQFASPLDLEKWPFKAAANG